MGKIYFDKEGNASHVKTEVIDEPNAEISYKI